MAGYGGFGGGQGFLGQTTSPNENNAPQQGKWGDGSIMPMTVAEMKRAVQEHPDAPFFCHNKQLARVALVGRVAKKAEATSNLQVLVEDGTGSIDVHLYVDDSASENVKQQIAEGVYVKAIGQLRSFAEKRSLKANRILLIEDMDEVTHHGLAALFAIKSLQRAPTQSAYGAIGGGGGGGAAAYGGGAASTSYGAPGGVVPMAVSANNNSKAAVEQSVLAVVQNCGDDAGASVQSICDALRLSEKAVREAIDALATDGHVYSTIDDDHYKGCN